MFDLDLLTSTDPFEIDTQAAWPRPAKEIPPGAGRSAAIQHPKNLPTNTGEIDDRSDDPR